jgi:hypothetical protein
MFATQVDQLPSWFQMPCIAHQMTGQAGHGTCLVSASSGLGLSSCADHVELTEQVLRRLRNYELAGLRASFISAGLTTAQQDERGPGEGVVYGSLPGSGARDHAHSVTDVMFGRTHR